MDSAKKKFELTLGFFSYLMLLLEPTRDLRNRRSVDLAMFLLNNLVMLPNTLDRPESRLEQRQRNLAKAIIIRTS